MLTGTASSQLGPQALEGGQTGVLEVEALQPVCMETMQEGGRLSRFLIRENGVILAVGFVRERL